MTVRRIVNDVTPSLMFIIMPAIMFSHRFLESLIAGLAVVVVITCTILIGSSLRFVTHMITRLAHVLIAMTLVTFVQIILELSIPEYAYRLKVFLPLLILNIILLSPARYYLRGTPPFAVQVKVALVFSLVFGLCVTILGLMLEVLIFREVSLSFVQRENTQVIDSPFRMLLFVPGSLLFLGYIHAALSLLKERQSK